MGLALVTSEIMLTVPEKFQLKFLREMKKNLFVAMAGLGAMFSAALPAAAQGVETVVTEEVITEANVDCKTNYSSSWRNNWFLQIGAGIQSPFVENYLPNGEEKHHITAVYNLGFGHWFSPYLALRFSGYYGSMHWDNHAFSRAKTANLNLDLMWDMLNSISGPNTNRVFGIVPFVGIGGTFNWDYDAVGSNIFNKHNQIRRNQWLLPVSAGIQFRFRLCRYVDFFVEGRASLYGDNFNNCSVEDPIDVNLQAIGGFTFNFGGRRHQAYNPCEYLGYIKGLNDQVNSLRGELAATAAALAAAEAQLPCPEAVTVVEESQPAPMLAAVRFKLNSAVVSPMEMVNVYNVAEYLKANPDVKLFIDGYADKDTGSSNYNLELSEKRCNAVKNLLVEEYDIAADRLECKSFGSETQPYNTNNWNRVVLFRVK